MPRHDIAARKRLVHYGYVPAKQRTDTCGGCEHSSLANHGREGMLQCRRVGTVVSTGAKCNDWAPKSPGLKSISQGGSDAE